MFIYMKIAIVAFDDFTDIDVFFPWDLLNRVKVPDWEVKILGDKASHTSIAGLMIPTHEHVTWANQADAVLFASGPGTRRKYQDLSYLEHFKLNPEKQLIGAMCSGSLILASLGLLKGKKATTYPSTKALLTGLGVEVIDEPFVLQGNVATAAACLAAQELAGWIIEKLVDKATSDKILASIQPISRTGESTCLY